MADTTGAADNTVIIKKYATRRLYNTQSSSYITLDHLAKMTRENIEFRVLDAKTGTDITHQILTQIIMDEEASGEQMLPVNFLPEYPFKDLIGCDPSLRDEKWAPVPRTADAIRVHRAEYYATVSHLDRQIGRILDALDDPRLDEFRNRVRPVDCLRRNLTAGRLMQQPLRIERNHRGRIIDDEDHFLLCAEFHHGSRRDEIIHGQLHAFLAAGHRALQPLQDVVDAI